MKQLKSTAELRIMVMLLKKARQNLRDSGTNPLNGVCRALLFAANNDHSDELRYLYKWINQMMCCRDGCGWLQRWLQSWLQRHGHLSMRTMHPADVKEEDRAKLRDTRIAWVNWMIQQLQDEMFRTAA